VGGVSLLLFCAAFSYAPYPGGYQTIHLPYSGLHPQGFTVSSYPAATFNELSRGFHAFSLLSMKSSIVSSLTAGRVVSVSLPWLSPPAFACGYVSGWWEDFPQQHRLCATVSRTLPLPY